MDRAIVTPRMLKGVVDIPPSKSVAHRAIIAAALSGGECIIRNIEINDDIMATLGGVRGLGFKYTLNQKNKTVKIAPKKNGIGKGEVLLDCKESGSTLRFLMPVSLLFCDSVKLTGQGRLMQRPQKPYLDMFDKCKIKYKCTSKYIKVSGVLKSGVFEMAGDVSSQFITGLLFALPLLDGDSEIVITTPMESKPYIDITLKVLSDFGIKIENKDYKRFIIKGGQKYKPIDYTVEGDYSQAAFFLVAGALGGDVLCRGLSEDSLQGDREIIEIIKQTGAKIEKSKDGIKAIHTANMSGVVVDVKNIPDLVPILAVLLAFCKGESRIVNAGRLRLKESDRLTAISTELAKLGVDITEEKDGLKIVGGQAIGCKEVSSWGDHRIAMATAIAGCRCEGEKLIINNAISAVRKSYPDFFDVYNKL